jgi:diguanylate cyclase (GGDEF)-like protein
VEIGRDPGCELPLHVDNVSWRHARVEDRGGGEWVLVDLGSTNGTLVNGLPHGGATLRVGDRVFIGRSILEVQQDPVRDAQAAEIERLLSVDELSGLWVKRRFDVQLQSSVAAVLSGSVQAICLVVMDMDGVKTINDTHGHSMGAFAIGETGRLIGACVRGRGFATRFGGDEFAAAFPGRNKIEAVAIAEEIRAAVCAYTYEKDGIRVHAGLSCGVAALPGDASDSDALFQAADQAMYRAKRAGKNRVST